MQTLFSDPEPATSQFLAGEAPEHLRRQLRSAEQKLAQIQSRHELPGPLILGSYLFLLWCAYGLLTPDSLLQVLWRRFLQAKWIITALALLAASALLWEHLSARHCRKTEAYRRAERMKAAAEQEIDSVLNIPKEARAVDLLSIRRHGSKGGKIGVLLRCKLFQRDGHLWILQGQRLFALPLDPTASLAFQKEGIFIHNWNQERAAWRAEYRKAGVSTMQGEPARLRYFCCLTTRLGQEEFRLLFPAYELSAMQELTGLSGPKPLRPEKLSPVFYWLPPKKAHLFNFNRKNELCPWEFSDQHPVAYGLFVALLFLALIVPMLAYLWCQMRLRTPPASIAGILIGESGCFLLWIGFGSILSAWMKEYLGHLWTGLFLLAGSGLLILAGQL